MLTSTAVDVVFNFTFNFIIIAWLLDYFQFDTDGTDNIVKRSKQIDIQSLAKSI